jgi:hypothetical protein
MWANPEVMNGKQTIYTDRMKINIKNMKLMNFIINIYCYFYQLKIKIDLKKWWVESDFKAPNLPLSLQLKVSGCLYNSIYNNTWTKQVKQFSKHSHVPLHSYPFLPIDYQSLSFMHCRIGKTFPILKHQTSPFHYGSKFPAVSITVFITILEQNR